MRVLDNNPVLAHVDGVRTALYMGAVVQAIARNGGPPDAEEGRGAKLYA